MIRKQVPMVKLWPVALLVLAIVALIVLLLR